ncbi:Uncharacterised protein [Chlamydia trachomatis]|nr:Uncharacterised protein [Chlamydia trachomatis]
MLTRTLSCKRRSRDRPCVCGNLIARVYRLFTQRIGSALIHDRNRLTVNFQPLAITIIRVSTGSDRVHQGRRVNHLRRTHIGRSNRLKIEDNIPRRRLNGLRRNSLNIENHVLTATTRRRIAENRGGNVTVSNISKDFAVGG